MEAVLTRATSDQLTDGLNCTPPNNTANYCVANRRVAYFVESGDRFNPNSGAKTIRFRIADHGFWNVPVADFDLH